MIIKIPIHSFIDLITNSSSETFTSSDEKTLESIKSLVNRLLIAGGSTKTFDDLFIGYVGYPVDGVDLEKCSSEIAQAVKEQGCGKWDDVVLTEELIKVGIENEWFTEDDVRRTRGEHYENMQVVIISKNDDEESKKLARSVWGITDGYGLTYTYYNG